MRSQHKLALFTSVVSLAAFVAPAVSWAATDSGSESVRTDEVCFSVHNQGDPEASPVYGIRYYDEVPSTTTKAIILVHGAGPTHDYWDVRRDFSIARNLARAGYLVIAYDRLGYGKSPYRRPQGGHLITASGDRAMLHEIVEQVKTGTYSAAVDDGCAAGGGRALGLATPTVVIVGDSLGGGIVNGYPGTYHDVAAAVTVGWSNQGFSPSFTQYFVETAGPGYASGKDYFRLVPDEKSCQKTTLYFPGVLPALLHTYCKEGYGPAPTGEFTFAGRFVAENLAAITRVGPGLPVLLAFADHDFLFPPDRAAAEFEYWSDRCGCDVETWTQSDSGHAVTAHRTMPTFTTKVADWLASKGLAAK